MRALWIILICPIICDTEWLIAAGLFADEKEACAESCEDVDVLWSKEGAEQGYCFTVNKALISEKALAQLTEAVSFKEGAFEPLGDLLL